MLKVLKLTLLVLMTTTTAFAGTFSGDAAVSIPIKPTDTLPANDLLFTEASGKNIYEAWAKEKTGFDLSTLEPDPTSEFYSGDDHRVDGTALDDSLPISEGETVDYVDTLQTAEGRFRFNAKPTGPALLSFVISPTLHTILLRKEILRKLGYKIPAMKWLPHVRIRFPDANRKTLFYNAITISTNAAGSNWEIQNPDDKNPDPLVVDFKDVVVMETGASANLALGPPVQLDSTQKQFLPQTDRIFRALSIPYGIVDLKKSVNQFDWTLGSVDGTNIQFNVSVMANYGTGMDDALWILRKIASFNRDDFVKIVDGAKLPKEISILMVEKLISRTNALYELPGLKNVAHDSKLKPDFKVDAEPAVKNGKVLQKDWPGYVTPFAFGDQASPLKDIKYYFLSQLENGVIQNLMKLANKEIPGLTQDKAYQAHQDELLKTAMTQWQQTGSVQNTPFKVWPAPILNGGVNISRGVVIGSYMGTNNLVSLADSFGVSLNAGVSLSTDGLPSAVRVGALIQGSASLTVTHLKQLRQMKQTLSEPIANEFVPYMFFHSSKLFSKIENLKAEGTTVTPDELQKEVSDEFDQVRKMIGVGDSLILSFSVSGLEQVSAGVGFNIPATPNASISVGANQLVIWRVQLYRKDENTIQVFKDKGHLNAFDANLQVSITKPAQFPIVSLDVKTTKGAADVHVFNLNIAKDLAQNPKLFETAGALSSILRTGSVKVLESQQKPVVIRSVFRDKSGNFRILHHVNRKLSTEDELAVELPDATEGHYLSLTYGRQKGRDFQRVTSNAVNFIIQSLTHQTQWTLDTLDSNAPNPGNTFYGNSFTRNSSFQGDLTDGLQHPFVKIQYAWQGFSKSADDARSLIHDLSDQFGFQLYSDESLRSLRKIQLYQIGLSINVYEDGLKVLAALTPRQIEAITNKYQNEYGCFLNLGVYCKAIVHFKKAYKKLHKDKTTSAERAQAIFMMAQSLEDFAHFPDFLQCVGGKDHIYISPRISGFWTDSEINAAVVPPPAQTFGRVDGPFKDGVLRNVEDILNIDDGEFYAQWLREVL